MKYFKLFIAAAAVFSLAACSGKQDKAAETAGEETAAAQPAPVAAAPGEVVELTDAASLAPGTKVDRLTIVDFNAVWCGPCRMLAPVVDEMAKKYAGKADFISVDVDKFGELMEAYHLGNSIPVVLFLKPDGTSSYYVGTDQLLPAEKLDKLIQDNL